MGLRAESVVRGCILIRSRDGLRWAILEQIALEKQRLTPTEETHEDLAQLSFWDNLAIANRSQSHDGGIGQRRSVVSIEARVLSTPAPHPPPAAPNTHTNNKKNKQKKKYIYIYPWLGNGL